MPPQTKPLRDHRPATAPVDSLEDLVQRAQQRDVDAFERLVAEHIPLIRRFARAFTRGPDEAAALAQDALLDAYGTLGTFRFHTSFSTWLYAAVRRVYLEDARHGGHRAYAPLERLSPITTCGPCPEREERRVLWEALRTLPAELRATIVLRDVEGLPCAVIAELENTSLGDVESRVERGLEQLRRALAR